MKIKYIIVLLFILLEVVVAEDYRTIQRNTVVKDKKGVVHNKIKDFGNYYAILIYVEDYTYFKKLHTPNSDITDIAKILKDRYGFKIKIIDNPNNGDDLLKQMTDVTNKLTSNDNLIIYYAGHGSKGGFWQLKDANTNGMGWISVKLAVNKTIEKIPAKHILVISDSCYAGLLTRGEDGNNVNNISINDKKYYSKLQQLKSRTVFASGGEEPVADKDPTDPTHSAFASGFIDMLSKNDKAIFSLEEKFFIVKRHVMAVVPNQTPLYKDIKFTGFDDGGDFIFIDKKSVYKNKDIKPTQKEDTYAPNTQPISLRENVSEIDNILIWALGIVSLLLLILSVIYFRTRKKIPLGGGDEDREFPPPPPPPKEGTITMGKLTYQNQPFKKQYTWQEAKEYAKNLRLGGFDDWRLPSLRELRALGNIELYNGEDNEPFWQEWYQNNKDKAVQNSKGEKHFVHEKLVENMPKNSIFWSSESKDEYDVYMVAFNLGANYVEDSTSKHYVLCVRDNK